MKWVFWGIWCIIAVIWILFLLWFICFINALSIFWFLDIKWFVTWENLTRPSNQLTIQGDQIFWKEIEGDSNPWKTYKRITWLNG